MLIIDTRTAIVNEIARSVATSALEVSLRERELLDLAAKGDSTKGIAYSLAVPERYFR